MSDEHEERCEWELEERLRGRLRGPAAVVLRGLVAGWDHGALSNRELNTALRWLDQADSASRAGS